MADPKHPSDKPAPDKPPRRSRGDSEPQPSGRFAYEGLERVIHEKARLGILASLASKPNGLLFGDLKELCSLTDGNLSRHLQMLQEAGLVEVWKGFKKNRPQTLARITETGRRRFSEYIAVLENVVADALAATGRAAEARLPLSNGFIPT